MTYFHLSLSFPPLAKYLGCCAWYFACCFWQCAVGRSSRDLCYDNRKRRFRTHHAGRPEGLLKWERYLGRAAAGLQKQFSRNGPVTRVSFLPSSPAIAKFRRKHAGALFSTIPVWIPEAPIKPSLFLSFISTSSFIHRKASLPLRSRQKNHLYQVSEPGHSTTCGGICAPPPPPLCPDSFFLSFSGTHEAHVLLFHSFRSRPVFLKWHHHTTTYRTYTCP